MARCTLVSSHPHLLLPECLPCPSLQTCSAALQSHSDSYMGPGQGPGLHALGMVH